MKGSYLLSSSVGCLVALLASSPLSAAGPTPELQYDPDTVSPCLMWVDNADDLNCEEVRQYWNITSREFSQWNPSVGLNCQPWGYQSYCVVPQVRLPITTNSTAEPTTVTTTTVSTTTSSLGPSPTSWSSLGCYIDDDEALPVLEKRISAEGGDASLTISKCKDSCYKAFLAFAGVKAGNQCWCSDYVGGEFASNATECKTPCSGNRTEMCGGQGRINVFTPIELDEEDGASTTSAGVVSGQTHSSGANKYRAMF